MKCELFDSLVESRLRVHVFDERGGFTEPTIIYCMYILPVIIFMGVKNTVHVCTCTHITVQLPVSP